MYKTHNKRAVGSLWAEVVLASWAHWYSRYEIKIFKEFGISDNLTAFSAFTINVIGAEKDYFSLQASKFNEHD